MHGATIKIWLLCSVNLSTLISYLVAYKDLVSSYREQNYILDVRYFTRPCTEESAGYFEQFVKCRRP